MLTLNCNNPASNGVELGTILAQLALYHYLTAIILKRFALIRLFHAAFNSRN